MRNGTTLVRVKDGKHFKVTLLSHWSDIQAEDGEQDRVKWYGMDGYHQAYVSASKGHTYKKLDPEAGPVDRRRRRVF